MKLFAVLVSLGFAFITMYAEQRTRSTIPATTTFTSGETAATLVELFTSEGCSSCPPADAWMSRLKRNPDLWKAIVPAVFHVDYWDRLGWPDRFARPEFTRRQRLYASSWPTGA